MLSARPWIFLGLTNPGGSRNSQNSKVALEKLKNQIHWIEVELGLDRISLCPDSNGVNDTQIRFCMLNIFTVKFLVKLGQVAANNEAKIWKIISVQNATTGMGEFVTSLNCLVNPKIRSNFFE